MLQYYSHNSLVCTEGREKGAPVLACMSSQHQALFFFLSPWCQEPANKLYIGAALLTLHF